jgi:GNAT superfamily N-acetyltransferase
VACVRWPDEDSDPILIAMWVEEAFRGTGVADALIADVLGWGRSRGFDVMTLGVTEGNETARKLYIRHGFEPTGRWETLKSFPDLQIEWMSRPL